MCTGLNERRKSEHKPRIDHDLLRTAGGAIIAEFYEDCVQGLPERARRFIEDELITERGFRNPYPKEDALGQGFITEPELEGLVKRRLLRVEPHLGIDRIELIHDLLTGVVRDFRDRERQRQQREQNEKKEKKRRVQLALAGVLALVGLGLAGAFFWLWQDAKASRERADSALRDAVTFKLAIESRGILEGTHAGTDRLGLLLAAAAYRLEAIPEALGALQYGLRATADLLRIVEAGSSVSSVAFSPDGAQIASGGADGTVRLWDAHKRTPLGEPLRGHQGSVSSVAFSPDGAQIASGGADDTVRLWEAPAAWPDLVCAKLTQNLSHAEWRRYVGDLPYQVQCPNLPVPPD